MALMNVDEITIPLGKGTVAATGTNLTLGRLARLGFVNTREIMTQFGGGTVAAPSIIQQLFN